VGEFFSNLWTEIGLYVSMISIIDIIDILIVAFLIYKILAAVIHTSAMQILKAILLIVVVTGVSELIGLSVVNFALKNVLQIGLIALVIVFQPELRRGLEQVGGSSLSKILGKSEGTLETEKAIMQTVEACAALSLSRTGTLIVFERTVYLSDIIKTGTVINSDVSAELLKNIFYPKAPLHDGAVIVSKNRVAAAGCMLPLSTNNSLSRDLGMRHRAGIGVSEVSDVVSVIVSEETGAISVAVGGMLKRHLAPETLEKLLRSELMPASETEKKNLATKVISVLKPANKKGDGKDG